ncbi:MAG: TonB-dependent receptor [Acidobacteria bacterium]|nr:Vitamin B12 transporter BtuB [Pyrinomonadaceae bacterium]RIJ90021.1 MAG: TonB-dependent receptor [Acidobacteriota bacterium]
MKKLFIVLAVAIAASPIFAQDGNSLRLKIKNSETNQAVADVTVTVVGTDRQAVSAADGRVEITGIPNGEHSIDVFSPGYERVVLKLTFPLADASERVVLLTINTELGSVTVNLTRTGREIEDEPTRVESIDEEEVDEKINMRPANVSMVLHESTGIQVNQTSAASATQSIRIQGLDGRYTQLLKDGFPAFGGFSGSLSILEIPPLDLKQVEVIKGPSGTLYGAGAIAGVVNFVSKTPSERQTTSLILNQTSALGTDFSIFTSRRYARFGYTLLGSANYQREYDVDDDDFTELPRTKAFTVNPRFFITLDDKTELTIGSSFGYQSRVGGDIFAISKGPNGIHQYFEKSDSLRSITTLNLARSFTDGSRFVGRQSLAFFSRTIKAPGHEFKGSQFNSYTDLAYYKAIGRNAFVLGANVVYDRFRETRPISAPLDRSETRTTVGVFVQDTVDITPKLSIEAGLRVDRVADYGTFVLPRVSLLYRFSDHLTSRIGYGLGYKPPSVFTEDAEEKLFENVVSIGNTLKAERSQGGTFDLNYTGTIGDKIEYSINQLFFYTQITKPLVLTPGSDGLFRFSNAASPIVSKGGETNFKATYGIAKLFVGYTFTDAKAGYLTGNRRLTLLPRHKVNSSFVLEKAESFKTGVEYYFGSRQVLDDRSLTRNIHEFGIFAEKTFGKISIFINGENLFDERQGRYSPVVLGPHSNPTFAEIYTHTEGRIFNGGIKLRF